MFRPDRREGSHATGFIINVTNITSVPLWPSMISRYFSVTVTRWAFTIDRSFCNTDLNFCNKESTYRSRLLNLCIPNDLSSRYQHLFEKSKSSFHSSTSFTCMRPTSRLMPPQTSFQQQPATPKQTDQ
ncbi:hypothetical protein E2C01_060157 [Portunus trituberculatus]|uniref:Uncharacterized protein n=1 Tax=Portunus trituberculatus TaxID=210409 RepID=A0A5B7HB95_PORTR|nr:hypothetical protein [Portunus trituberculatus]